MGRNYLIAALALGAGVIPSAPARADTRAGVDAWTKGDYAGAVKEWQVQAAKGDADALFNLGQAYKLGKGVKQDLIKAEQLFAQAAAMGHLQAGDNYGLLLFQRGDRQRGLPYIRAAADRGDPRAQYLLGVMHFNGELVPKDWVRAYALVTLAQQQGLPQAAGAMAQMDQHIPYGERQQGVQLAAELASQADATRARQLAAVDLGSQMPNPVPAPVRGPVVASAQSTAQAAQEANPVFTRPNDSYEATRARQAAANPVRVHQGPPPGVTPPAPRPVAAQPPRPAPAPAPMPVAGGSWRIQLGAFGVAANADALWARVKGRPEVAGHPRLNLKAGAVTKLQAGNYSQAAAQAACARLKAAGFTCVAVPN
ncbi:MAG: SPOR domain-containing protein [Novosphingobium sp.]|nr:SPOR domain-containing protein [Novosphingobium sp.]